MTEGSESYVWLGSQHNMECSGCQKLRKEVEDLRSMLMSNSLRQTDDDDVRYYSTRISEHKQMEIDKILLDARRKAETFQEAYEKALQEKHKLLALTDELKKQLDERANEAAVLKEQNAVYAADFQLEREDRERSQSRLIELEGQLAAASRRIADLEDDRQRYLTTVTTTRHLNPPIAVHSEFVTEPGMMPAAVYSEHHLPTYSSAHQPIVTHHHSRQSPRSYGRGYDVCDSLARNSHMR